MQVPPATVNTVGLDDRMLAIVSGALPLLVTVTVWAALVVPKLSVVTFRSAVGAVPVPVRLTTVGESVALWAIDSAATFAPVASGVKSTATVQLWPWASTVLAAQVVVSGSMKNEVLSAPVTAGTEVSVRLFTPALDTVNSWVADEVRTSWLPKSFEVRLTAGAGASGRSWRAVHAPVSGSLVVQKRRFSTFHRVSIPSSFPKGMTAVVNATVTLPSALGVIVYRSDGAE